MKKLIFLGLVSFCHSSSLLAEEYMSNEYYSEIISQLEDSSDFNELVEIIESNESTIELSEYNISSKEINITIRSIIDTPKIELSPYEIALKRAKAEDKVIMLSIRTTHCKYCDKMEETTLSDDSIKNALDTNFITVHYNQDLESLPLGLQEGMTPTFIFVNTNEDILNIYPGMRSPEEFKDVLEQILAM